MKKVLMRLLSILFYITVLMAVMGFDFQMLIDIRLLILVLLGMLVLSVPFYSKEDKICERGQLMAQKALEAGYLQSFILLFMSLSHMQHVNDVPYEIAMNCRPILYGYCLYVLLEAQPQRERQERQKKTAQQSSLDREELSIEEIEERFKKMGLSRRETEVAKAICKGMTNGEIAELLYISEGTVKKHVSHIFEKLQIEKREAIVEKLRKG